MYLENIFIGSEDIRKQLPQESIMFENVHNTFSRLMKQLAAVHNCLKVGAAGARCAVHNCSANCTSS